MNYSFFFLQNGCSYISLKVLKRHTTSLFLLNPNSVNVNAYEIKRWLRPPLTPRVPLTTRRTPNGARRLWKEKKESGFMVLKGHLRFFSMKTWSSSSLFFYLTRPFGSFYAPNQWQQKVTTACLGTVLVTRWWIIRERKKSRNPPFLRALLKDTLLHSSLKSFSRPLALTHKQKPSFSACVHHFFASLSVLVFFGPNPFDPHPRFLSKLSLAPLLLSQLWLFTAPSKPAPPGKGGRHDIIMSPNAMAAVVKTPSRPFGWRPLSSLSSCTWLAQGL